MTVELKWPALLPCPFCGKKLEDLSMTDGSTFRWIEVHGCCGWTNEIRRANSYHENMFIQEHADEAAAQWNTRAPPDTAALQARITKLEAALQEIAVGDIYTGGWPREIARAALEGS